MPTDDAGSGFSTPSRRSGTLIGGLGALLITAHGPPLTQIQGLTALLLTVGFPSLLGLVLIGVGYSTARERLVEPADAWRLATWIVVGMAVFLLVGVWIVVLDLLLGEPVPFGYLLTVNAVTLGGVVGAVIGLYDAQGREYTRKLERRERNLEEKNQRLDEFVSIVSHDLRNPLNVAEGRLQLAKDESGNEHLDHVERAHDRMGALIDDLLELARHNESTADIEPIDLLDVAESAWQSVETGDASLDAEAAVTVVADESQLQQLLENLFRNAVEHSSTGNEGHGPSGNRASPGDSRTKSGDAVEHSSTDSRTASDGPAEHEGASVTVIVGELDADTGFYVEDDGPGIPADRRGQVFELGCSGRPDGTGFGLAIVQTVVDAHGWDVRVTEGERGGARFEIAGVDVRGR